MFLRVAKIFFFFFEECQNLKYCVGEKKPEKRRTKDINMERLLSNLLLKNVFEKQKESTPRTRSMTQNLKVYIFDCQKKKSLHLCFIDDTFNE